MKLDVKAFGLSLGIIWAFSVVFMGLMAMFVPSYSENFVVALGTKYLGYQATPLGLVIGAVWGFFDVGILGALIAWLYNKLSK